MTLVLDPVKLMELFQSFISEFLSFIVSMCKACKKKFLQVHLGKFMKCGIIPSGWDSFQAPPLDELPPETCAMRGGWRYELLAMKAQRILMSFTRFAARYSPWLEERDRGELFTVTRPKGTRADGVAD